MLSTKAKQWIHFFLSDLGPPTWTKVCSSPWRPSKWVSMIPDGEWWQMHTYLWCGSSKEVLGKHPSNFHWDFRSTRNQQVLAGFDWTTEFISTAGRCYTHWKVIEIFWGIFHQALSLLPQVFVLVFCQFFLTSRRTVDSLPKSRTVRTWGWDFDDLAQLPKYSKTWRRVQWRLCSAISVTRVSSWSCNEKRNCLHQQYQHSPAHQPVQIFQQNLVPTINAWRNQNAFGRR